MAKKKSAFIVIPNKKGKVLLYKKKGMWTLPGGTVEKGEKKKKAAIRETFEEVGYEVTALKKFAHYKNKNGRKTDFYIAEDFEKKTKKCEAKGKNRKFFALTELPYFIPPKQVLALHDFSLEQKDIVKRKINHPRTKDYYKLRMKHDLAV